MKYRLMEYSDEIVVILEDGGIACIRDIDATDDMPDRQSTTDYYQTRFTQEDWDSQENIWEIVGEGKMYYNDWDTPFNDPKHIQDALEWLAVGESFELDETIWRDFKDE